MPRQNTPLTSQDDSNKGAAGTAQITIRGCVSGEKRYTFMQTGTGTMFALRGNTDRFAPVQGKLVEITATEYSLGGKSNELPELQVKSLRIVAEECPIQAQPPSKTLPPTRTDQHPPAPEKSPSTKPYTDPGTVNQAPPSIKNPSIEGDTGAPSPGTGNPPAPNPNANHPPPSPQND
jgi:hypothetical protein